MADAEDVIAFALERRIGSVPPGRRVRVWLDRDVFTGTSTLAGPHPVGLVERPTPDDLRIKLFSTRAGAEARALLEEDLLDIRIGREIHLE